MYTPEQMRRILSGEEHAKNRGKLDEALKKGMKRREERAEEFKDFVAGIITKKENNGDNG